MFLYKLKTKYEELSLPIKATIWSTVCSILQKGIGFFTMPIFSRMLTTEEYGIYTVFYSWASILSVLCTLKIASGAINNALIKYKEENNEVVLSAIEITFFLTIITSSFFTICYFFLNDVIGIPVFLVPILFIYVFFSSVVDIWSAKKRFEFEYKKLAVCALLIALLSPILGIIGIKIFNSYKANARVVGTVVVEMIIGAILTTAIFHRSKKQFDRKRYWSFLLKFSFPLIPHYLSTILLMQCDTVMISYLCGKSDSGIYGIAYSIAMLSTMFNTSINGSLLPVTYKSIESNKVDKLKKAISAFTILIGLINLVLLLVAPEILAIVAPSSYGEAINAIPPLIGSVFCMFLYTIFSNVEFYYGKTKSIALASVFAALINVGLNYILIKIYGFVGASYATLISYALLVVFHIINVSLVYGKRFIKGVFDYKIIGLTTLLFLTLIFTIRLIYQMFILRIVLFLILLLVVIILLFLYFRRRKHVTL